MKILVAIVHHWNPNGGGKHQSLRPNPSPRTSAFQAQILSLLRLSKRQSYLHLLDRSVYPANEELRHEIDIAVVTDGSNHILNHLDSPFLSTFKHVETTPDSPLMLGFEVHHVLASYKDNAYDLYCYLEDDLVINDSFFFQKVRWFTDTVGESNLLLPQRYEVASSPSRVDKFYIDGPLSPGDLRVTNMTQAPLIMIDNLGCQIPFEVPKHPHSGCFFLSHTQLEEWIASPFWDDGDTSFISPLESAASLGISRQFTIYKPCLTHASWLDIQHYGNSFHTLIAEPIK